jgi:hypothetical protein
MRTFFDGKRNYLCSDINWVEHYIKQNFQDNLDHMEYYLAPSGIRYSLWNSFKQNDVFDSLNTLGYGNGFSIYEHHDSYVNQFDFTSRNNTPLINEFYIINIKLLEEFIENFKQKAEDLLHVESNDNFFIPKEKFRMCNLNRSSFIEQKNIEKFLESISMIKEIKSFMNISNEQSLFPFSAKSI